MNDVKQLENSRAVVCNLCLATIGYDELVHTTWAKCGGECVGDGKASSNIREQLAFALGGVRALLEQDDGGLLDNRESNQRKSLVDVFYLPLEGLAAF